MSRYLITAGGDNGKFIGLCDIPGRTEWLRTLDERGEEIRYSTEAEAKLEAALLLIGILDGRLTAIAKKNNLLRYREALEDIARISNDIGNGPEQACEMGEIAINAIS